jgi:hypothetical protein
VAQLASAPADNSSNIVRNVAPPLSRAVAKAHPSSGAWHDYGDKGSGEPMSSKSRFPQPLNRSNGVQLRPACLGRVTGVELRHTPSPSPDLPVSSLGLSLSGLDGIRWSRPGVRGMGVREAGTKALWGRADADYHRKCDTTKKPRRSGASFLRNGASRVSDALRQPSAAVAFGPTLSAMKPCGPSAATASG